ncbi:MAG: hypothetical protein ACI92I_000065 [Acidimicrobiales bacterium]|jgi:hypothetical protein
MINLMKAKLLGILMSVLSVTTVAYAAVDDIVPPELSNVQVVNNSETSITITWETDEDADSLVNYGLLEDYGIVRLPVSDRQTHSITLDDLEANRVYHFRVVSADEEGNQGISADYKVQTGDIIQDQDGTGVGSSESTTQEIIEDIKQITQVEQLQEILDVTIEAIQGITDALAIVGPPIVIPETISALVKWTTDRESNSTVLFSSAAEYVPGSYSFSQSSTDGNAKNHEVQLIGLEAFTEYHFKVQSTDSLNVTGESLDYTFKTKASLPNIRNLRIVKVEENAATLAWETTVPAKALIEYQDLTTGVQNSKGRPTLATTHQMRIADLTLGTRYVAFVIAENSGGDRVKSQPMTFITVRDTAPPLISNVNNESTLFPGDTARIQSIVEWKTDEPAYCTMAYTEGVAAGVEPTVIEADEISYAERHVEVIVDFAPATVYQFWLNCWDEAQNTVQSENFVLFTPIQEKSIIDLILENFESTFGWVKNITG